MRLITTAAFVLAIASTGRAQTVEYQVRLDGGQVVPPVATAGSGTVRVSLDVATGAVTVAGSYMDLGSNQTLAHIHGPALIGSTAGSIVTLSGTGGTAGNVTGNGVLTAMQVQEMLRGLHYINVHTVNEGNGEIRGQVIQQVSVQCPAELATDPLLTDVGGDPNLGPIIGDANEPFQMTMDCSNAGAPGLFSVVIWGGKLATGLPTAFGTLWAQNPKLRRHVGSHSRNVVVCYPSPLVLPADVAFVGLSYTVQGFCQDPTSPPGRISNAIQEWVGI